MAVVPLTETKSESFRNNVTIRAWANRMAFSKAVCARSLAKTVGELLVEDTLDGVRQRDRQEGLLPGEDTRDPALDIGRGHDLGRQPLRRGGLDRRFSRRRGSSRRRTGP